MNPLAAKLILVTLTLGWITSQATIALAAPPNVVMILSDDQAYTDYGFMGHDHIETPNLDRLAAESLTFTRGYVPTSLCRPSLATILTGLYPHQHGIVGNDPPAPRSAFNERGALLQTHPDYLPVRDKYVDHLRKSVTLCDRLKPLGYECLQTGKWWEGSWTTGGFTQGMTHGDPMRGGRHGDEGLKIGREGIERIDLFLQSMKESENPFLIWYAPMLPHTPHNPPQELLAKYTRRTPSESIAKYWAMCELFDRSVGELLQAINRQGFRENTIVVYVTDNGWINLPNQSAFAPRSKRSPYEGGLRTPIMLRWPSTIQAKRNDTDLASSIDLVPTLMAACGLEPDSSLPGINLMNTQQVANRHSVMGEIFEHDVVSMDQPAESLMYRWIISGQTKLIVPSSRMPSQAVELYDLASDPFEKQNIADADPDAVNALMLQMNAWWNGE